MKGQGWASEYLACMARRATGSAPARASIAGGRRPDYRATSKRSDDRLAARERIGQERRGHRRARYGRSQGMRLGTNTPRWIVVLGALAMAVLSIPGVAAEDTSERSDQAVIDDWATQLASAQAGLDADTTQLEAWAADGETLLVPLGAEIVANSSLGSCARCWPRPSRCSCPTSIATSIPSSGWCGWPSGSGPCSTTRS